MFHVYTAESDVVLRGDGGNGHCSTLADSNLASYVYEVVGYIKIHTKLDAMQSLT